MTRSNHGAQRHPGPLVYRQNAVTRLAHWTWAACWLFLLFSGLQIFNAHPTLYIGNESGFAYDNAVLRIGAVETPNGPEGRTRIFGRDFNTTGVLGVSGSADAPQYRGFPSAVTIPSYRDLATGRVVHFFFAWIFVATLLVWLIASAINGHLRRDIVPTRKDLADLPGDIVDHLRLRLNHRSSYGALQKLSYGAVLFGLFPLVVLTGLSMSPGMNAGFPWLLDVFGGRQTARTLHFVAVALMVLFLIVHIAMVLLAGPFNELRSMITGWYRTSPDTIDESAKGAEGEAS
ncbi:cytochrome b/b6 domain-containing protein [Hyphomicrobium sp. CS1GBMeth3]|uniref:cytochrome b/b6 domain-containing protein n=1 Tax=Hyphomicrobium sp. CS1GBMeth3 TaxID=1892845 RepID=UPI0009317892|nr:cytochrome b/b6 domain-containing protein [Hyphomicrobium sp. CS1GBMeth3]